MPTLEWANREGAVRAATRAPFRRLEHDPALSCGDPDNENMINQGDNLEGIKALMTHYAGYVPATGRQTFMNSSFKRLSPALGFVTLRRDCNISRK